MQEDNALIREENDSLAEDEKENLKDQFNLLDDEHRKIEREKKNLKLGEWNVGLSKAIFQYDPEQYDKEIQNIIERSRRYGQEMAEHFRKKKEVMFDELILITKE